MHYRMEVTITWTITTSEICEAMSRYTPFTEEELQALDEKVEAVSDRDLCPVSISAACLARLVAAVREVNDLRTKVNQVELVPQTVVEPLV